MKKRKIFMIAFVVLSLWGLFTIMMTCPPPFCVEDMSDQPMNEVNVLESKIDSLVKNNNILHRQIKAHVSRIRSNQLGKKLRLNRSRTDSNAPVIIHKKEEEVAKNVKLAKSSINFTGLDKGLVSLEKHTLPDGQPVIAVLVFTCDRVTVKRSLDLLLRYRPSKQQFPIIVSQDCAHKPTTEVIRSYGEQLFLIQQPDQSDIPVPPKEKKFKGYFKIARHYGWALNYTFNTIGFKTVIIVEDDLDVSEDFFEYFLGTYWLLRADATLWCISAWNDNGNAGLIDESQPQLLYRTDFFPGLGWMLTDSLWAELSVKWPRAYWDDWIRKPEQRKERACIRPEVSRTKTFGKIGVSNGLFYEKHLKFIKLNEEFISFTQMNLSFLLKNNYDPFFIKQVYGSDELTIADINEDRPPGPSKILYRTKEDFKKFTKQLGLMDDFRSGVPRTAYMGVIPFSKAGRRIYLAPQLPWKGYNTTWS